MRQNLHFPSKLRSILFGAAMATAACTFTSCEKDMVDELDAQETLQSVTENGAIIKGKYIVVFKQDENLRMNPSATYEQKVNLVREVSSSILSAHSVSDMAVEQTYAQAISGIAVSLSDKQVEELRRDERVAYVEPDRIVTLAKPGSGGSGSAVQEVPYGIKRVGYASGAGKTAWVIDTGVDLDHPDLNVDVTRSRTMFTSGRDAGSADDGNGHGTHVAGTIAALNNSIGVVGVAYGASVVAVKVLDSRGSGSYSVVIKGVDYVAGAGRAGDVANMSLGGPVSQALDDAVTAAAVKGIKFALAAGNESTLAANSSPARVNHTNVYTVSAMDASNRFASFSNYGNPPVDYCAPGVNIKSTWKGGAYNTISGTSMASPHVAGLLLITGGELKTDGYVTGDRDTSPDPIAHF